MSVGHLYAQTALFKAGKESGVYFQRILQDLFISVNIYKAVNMEGSFTTAPLYPLVPSALPLTSGEQVVSCTQLPVPVLCWPLSLYMSFQSSSQSWKVRLLVRLHPLLIHWEVLNGLYASATMEGHPEDCKHGACSQAACSQVRGDGCESDNLTSAHIMENSQFPSRKESTLVAYNRDLT